MATTKARACTFEIFKLNSCFVYREGYYLQRKEPREATVEHAEWQAKMNEVAHLAEIIIGKQRHGPIGKVTLEFEERFTKFKDTQIN